jgi:antirestriction protein ArdC
MANKAIEKYQQDIVDTIIDNMEKNPNFIKEWSNIPFEPHNGSSGHVYQGVNQINLTMRLMGEHADDPRFYTFKQIQDMDLKLEKGSKGSKISFFKTVTKELEEENGKTRDVNIPILKLTSVFPAKNVIGLEPYEKTAGIDNLNTDKELYEKLSSVIDSVGVEIKHGGNSAYYSKDDDVVNMPAPERFSSKESYAATLLHELSHATSHESRLNRDTSNYAKEELKAELSSVFTCQKLGIKYELENDKSHIENSSAYLKSWISDLKDDKRELFRAATSAGEITNYLTKDLELTKEQQINKDVEISR